MTTAQVWIDQTRNMLLSGYVEELLTLTTPPTSLTDPQMTITGASTSGIVQGSIIEIDSELLYVTTTPTNTLVNTIRGYAGTTPAVHLNNAIVRMSPKFPTHRIIESINDDLRDLSAPDSGLFQMLSTSFTYKGAVDGYNMLAPDGTTLLTNEEVQSIYMVTFADVGIAATEPDVASWRLKRNRNTDTFSSGLALILYGIAVPGRLITVNYKSPFIPITSALTLQADTGLQKTAYDLVPLGAAMALMTTTPIRREFLDAQGSSRRAEEVPPGAIAASFRDLMGRRRARLAAESSRLAAMYPQMYKRNIA
tara:strand:+ start:156 stop:1082 length:927 start_codon:yes stop_codon:yes gene_type:complete